MHEFRSDRLRVFTWHIHGTYLYYLSQCNCDFYIPVNEKKDEGYYGRGQTFPFGDNVIEVPAEEVKNMNFDCILFQTNKNYLADQYEILSEEQRKLPRAYLEHDPPAKNPTDQKHIMNDAEVKFVHVTNFNKLFWFNEVPDVRVIDHGVIESKVPYTGEYNKGLTIVNHLHQRGRKLGADIFDQVAAEVPVDLIGMGTKEFGGSGEVLHPQLPDFISRYRFMFNPIRYTSLGLAVLEAMSAGLPLVALATTEYVTVIKDGYNGFIHTDVDYLIEKMKLLLHNKELAMELGANAKQTICERFSIERFTKEWEQLFASLQLNKKRYEEESSIYQ
jgi:hypothetical protein